MRLGQGGEPTVGGDHARQRMAAGWTVTATARTTEQVRGLAAFGATAIDPADAAERGSEWVGPVGASKHLGVMLANWRAVGKPMPFALSMGHDPVIPFVDRDVVAGSGELLGCSESRGS